MFFFVGPVPNSFLPFWFMVWNQRVSSIVMTTNLMENGKVSSKGVGRGVCVCWEVGSVKFSSALIW